MLVVKENVKKQISNLLILLKEMKLIAGLGNPGKEYENTRHNLGFWVIDNFAWKLGVELKKSKFCGLYYQEKDFILLKPQTYMNNSGECIVAFLNYFAIPVNNF